jgi:hypothetical protein
MNIGKICLHKLSANEIIVSLIMQYGSSHLNTVLQYSEIHVLCDSEFYGFHVDEMRHIFQLMDLYR